MKTLLACVAAKAIAGLAGLALDPGSSGADSGRAESALVVTLIEVARDFLDFKNFLRSG
jgi:hypothetical protein